MLRVAIGWHFAYEGIWKFESWQRGTTPFSAEGYLRNASGPLAPYFRGMVPDVNGLAKLDPIRLKQSWSHEVERIGEHYGFNADQRAKANSLLTESQKYIDAWDQDRENREKRAKYYHDLRAVQKLEQDPTAMANERDWAVGERRTLASDLKDVVKDLDARGTSLRDDVIKLATPEQVASSGAYKPSWTLVDVAGAVKEGRLRLAIGGLKSWTLVDLNSAVTAVALVAIGFCLIGGLFTRPAALGGVAFLALIYLCMPPWPGLPPNPLAEGHFLYVDKNLVELLALLALAALPTGHWIGLDAVLFGWRRRRRDRRRAEAQAQAQPQS